MEKETSWFCLIFQSEDLLLRHLYFLHIIIIIIILRGISSAHDKFSIKSNTFENNNNWLLSYSCNKSLCFYQKEARFLLSAPCTFCLVVTLKRISLPVSLYDVLYGKTVGISLLWHTHTFPGLFIVVGDMIWITRVKKQFIWNTSYSRIERPLVFNNFTSPWCYTSILLFFSILSGMKEIYI